ncbi:MAG: DUF3341 domain-containing protein [Chloroflexi bacterium]|nr:DUF3341 domain-containing protein [Chloroflexota bacterium]
MEGYQGRYEPQMYVAIFDDVERVPDALDALRQVGVTDEFIQVQSGVPYASSILGRPRVFTAVPKYGLVGAFLGFLSGLFFTHGTAALYPLYVGGFPLYSVPPSLVLLFELTMLGLLVATFIGVLVESLLPPVVGKRVYHPAVSDSAIAVFFQTSRTLAAEARKALQAAGAQEVTEVEGSFV